MVEVYDLHCPLLTNPIYSAILTKVFPLFIRRRLHHVPRNAKLWAALCRRKENRRKGLPPDPQLPPLLGLNGIQTVATDGEGRMNG